MGRRGVGTSRAAGSSTEARSPRRPSRSGGAEESAPRSRDRGSGKAGASSRARQRAVRAAAKLPPSQQAALLSLEADHIDRAVALAQRARAAPAAQHPAVEAPEERSRELLDMDARTLSDGTASKAA